MCFCSHFLLILLTVMDISAILMPYLRGFMAAFYAMLSVYFLRSVNRDKGPRTDAVYRLSSLAMLWLSVVQMASIAVSIMSAAGMVGSGQYMHHERFVNMVDMMTVLCFGVMLVGMSSLKVPRVRYVYTGQIPLLIAIVAYAMTDADLIYHMASTYTVVYSVAVIVIVHLHVHRYQVMLDDTYSNTSRRGEHWVLLFMYALILQLSLWYIMVVYNSNDVYEMIYFVISMALWFAYVARVRRQRFELAAVVEAESEAVAPVDEREYIGNRVDLSEKIRSFCAQKDNFCNSELNVNDIAVAIGSNRTYVSRAFREMGTSFNSYINGLRLDYAEELLLNTNDSILEICSIAGFGTVQNFRRIFNARHGCSPREFRQNHSA